MNNKNTARRLRFIPLAVLAFGFLHLIACSSRADIPRIVVGVGTHVASDQGLDRLKQAGILAVRDDIFWSRVEKEKGVLAMPERYEHYVAALLQRQIEPLLILGYGNEFYDKKGYPTSEETLEAYARYCEFVVNYFKGRVHRYEIWNEWDHGCGMPKEAGKGSPEGYVNLIKRVYPRLKAIDPELTILGAGIADPGGDKGTLWLESACSAGLLDYLDGVSFHPYCFSYPPARRIPEVEFLRRCQSVDQTVQRFSRRPMPLYITEIGWPNQTGKAGSSLEESALYLKRGFLLASAMPNVRGIWWYDLIDDGADPAEREHNFGLLKTDLSPKPAYATLKDIAGFLGTFHFVAAERLSGGIHVLKYKDSSNRWAVASWCERAGEQARIALSGPDLRAKEIVVRGAGEPAKLNDRSRVVTDGGEFIFEIGNMPLIIETGEARELRITVQ
jgi:hypothetical protein